MASDLGKCLRRARKEKGIGLRELARAVKKSPALITRLENEGEVPSVSPETLGAIAEVLDLPVDQLLVLAQRAPEELSPRTEVEFALYRRVKNLGVAEQKKLLQDLQRRASRRKGS